MPDIEVTKAFIFDPLPIAHLIESRAMKYLNTAQILGSALDIVDRSNVKYNNAIIKKSDAVENTFPVVGLEIVKAYVNTLLTAKSGWLKLGNYSASNEIYKFILPEYHHNDDVWAILSDILIEIRTDVNGFVGDDKFIMHFMRTRKTDIVIEKTIDYRIYDWMQKFGSEIKE
jgi:hypothetical protein